MDYKANIGGKEYPILFDLLALSDFSKDKGIVEINKLDLIFSGFKEGEEGAKIDQLDDLAKLTFYGLKSGCEENNITFDLTERKVFRWLFKKGEDNISVIMKAINDFTQSTTGDAKGEATPQAHLNV
jgi:hypothetical protein